MKRAFLPYLLLLAINGIAQTGYEIKVTVKPFKNQYIYLAHYFGKTTPIVDSVRLNEKSEGVFKGSKKLHGGMYLVGYPEKKGFFEILVDKQQRFSVIADTATIRNGATFINSPENVAFAGYQKFLAPKIKEDAALIAEYQTAKTTADTANVTAKRLRLDSLVTAHRESIIKKNTGNIVAAFLAATREPVLPAHLRKPKTRDDSIAVHYFIKNHYWDGVNFWDGRLAYTSLLEQKIDNYLASKVVPDPDSIIYEIDRMLGPAAASAEMTRFLLVKFVNRYLNQKFMYEDKIFVHLYEKYFANKTYSWLDTNSQKLITNRAYSLMANILGITASDIDLPDSTGTPRFLFADTSAHTLVVFWDPSCGHCKEVLPKIDSVYRATWKAGGVYIYAVAKETDGTRKDWLNFINEQKLEGWTHVYYSKETDKARIDASIPGYAQLYDVKSYPTLYLLDKEKRIIAKKLTYDQLFEIWQERVKQK